ncbi:MAG: serine/threonine-protein kinase [Kiritimatiellaeota bacterium]|nr:serine/threonine-protein kinase [Kiritimatiellota bacterium]
MKEDPTIRIQVPPTERIILSPSADGQGGGGPKALESPRNEKLFDQYTIYSKIGDGGMGIVYLARDRQLGRFVAIKRLNAPALASPPLRQRFLHEARAVASLSHAHIIHIYALGEDDDGPYMVMEYIAGPDDPEVQKERQDGGLVKPNNPLTLDQHVARHGQYTTDNAIALAIKIARAVAYAHTCGVIHRDLKPSNILLDKSSEPKIVDFGLARLMQKEESKLTVPGEKLLSLGYGAPEQESDASLSDERSDVYGLGAVLYFVLTGQNPRYFREHDVPVQLRETVVKALATDKEQRWQSAQAFADELSSIQNKTRIELPTVKTTWRCKWCDAVNPLSLKYCAECGWDGSEICPECGADSFVGIQYCGNCGADARAYEMVQAVLKKMKEAAAQRRFGRVNQFAGRIHGFEPAGPEGRKLINEISDLRAEAEQNVQRRNKLKDQIPMEIRAENFERAALFIKQFRELSESQSQHAFAHEEQQLPGLILKRDLQRANQALNTRDWQTASRICDELLKTVVPNNPECRQIRKRIRWHQIRNQCMYTASVVLITLLIYLGALPMVARHLQGGATSRAPYQFYRVGIWLYEESLLEPLLQSYAQRWLPTGATLTDYIKPREERGTEGVATGGEGDQAPDELEQKKQAYNAQMDEHETARKDDMEAWPKEYLRELDDLMDNFQRAGDFISWENVRNERNHFALTKEIGDLEDDEEDDVLADLTLLRVKYHQNVANLKQTHNRKLLTLCNNYINDLTETRKVYTRDGKMELAATVNTEIQRVRHLPQYIEAAADPDTGFAPSSEDGQKEVADLRAAFEDQLAAAEVAATQNVAQWPEKYTAQLTDLMDNFQRAGDYIGWESVRKEMVRFDADRTIQTRHFISYPTELSELQRKYHQLRNEMRRTRAEQIISSTDNYVQELLALQRRLTVEGQMETAALIQAEIKRARARIDYIEAQSLIAPPTENPQ